MRDGHQYRNAHDAFQYILTGHGVAQPDVNLVYVFGRGSCQSAPFPHALQEILYHILHVDSRACIVRFEHVGAGGVPYRLFEEQQGAAHVDIPLIQRIAVQRACPPIP